VLSIRPAVEVGAACLDADGKVACKQYVVPHKEGSLPWCGFVWSGEGTLNGVPIGAAPVLEGAVSAAPVVPGSSTGESAASAAAGSGGGGTVSAGAAAGASAAAERFSEFLVSAGAQDMTFVNASASSPLFIITVYPIKGVEG
jgi:hypothetical protein